MCETGCQVSSDAYSEITFVAGQPYIQEWRRAREAAVEVSSALVEAGFDASELRAAPGSGADGEALVVVRGRPEAVQCLVCLVGRGMARMRSEFDGASAYGDACGESERGGS